MSAAAIRLGERVGYTGAGTVEFLYDVDAESFYFIEMNTRIQVEHPVTEEITGTDLVAWQLRIAAGEELVDQSIEACGHAMEFRITAEDPTRNFMPNPGTVKAFNVPGGPGVRCDTHCYSGYRVPPYYDSLLAKLVVSGRDREEVLRRARRALHEFRIEGISTTVGFHRWLMEQPEFRAGTHTTSYLDDFDGSELLRKDKAS
jgi:acetyl-CoA carboxylase biotin carboxylase subunit